MRHDRYLKLLEHFNSLSLVTFSINAEEAVHLFTGSADVLVRHERSEQSSGCAVCGRGRPRSQ